MPVSISCTKHLLKALCQRAHRKKNCNSYNTPSSTQIFQRFCLDLASLVEQSLSDKADGPKYLRQLVRGQSQWIHVWYIYLHLGDFYGKCRYIYHTWIHWEWRNDGIVCNQKLKRSRDRFQWTQPDGTWRGSHSIWHSIGQTCQRFTSVQTSSRYLHVIFVNLHVDL